MLSHALVFTEIEAPAELSVDFKSLQSVVSEVNDEYITKWCTKAKEKRKIFYGKNSIEQILETLPNLASTDGFKLVRNVEFLSINNFLFVTFQLFLD